MEIRSRLLKILRHKSLQLGHFKLVSGQTSSYYFDSKLTTLDPEGAYLTAKLILELIKRENIQVEAIGGPTLGADPVVSSVAAVSYAERNRYRPLPGFIVRKDSKKHGTQKLLEGFQARSGAPVLIFDDVCTTAGSTLEAIQKTETSGYQVSAVVCLVDREQGAAEALQDYPFHPLYTASQLLDDPTIRRELASFEPGR